MNDKKWKVSNDETPWTEGNSEIAIENDEALGEAQIFVPIESADGLIALCPWEPLADSEEQRELSRRMNLIAAAPDLLAACEAALPYISHLEKKLGKRAPWDATGAVNKLKAAIKAAKE